MPQRKPKSELLCGLDVIDDREEIDSISVITLSQAEIDLNMKQAMSDELIFNFVLDTTRILK
jgi:hypothetical protein